MSSKLSSQHCGHIGMVGDEGISLMERMPCFVFFDFFSKYYAKKGILLYTSTLTVTIFLQSAISLETKKTNTCPALRPWSNPWEVVGAI